MLGASPVDQWLRDSMLPLQGAQGLKETRRKKVGGGGGYCHGPLEAPRVYTLSLKLKLQKSLCMRVLDQICLLKQLMQPGSSDGRSQGWRMPGGLTWGMGRGRLRAGRGTGGDTDLGWESPKLLGRSQVTARCRSGALKRQSRRGMETWAEDST